MIRTIARTASREERGREERGNEEEGKRKRKGRGRGEEEKRQAGTEEMGWDAGPGRGT